MLCHQRFDVPVNLLVKQGNVGRSERKCLKHILSKPMISVLSRDPSSMEETHLHICSTIDEEDGTIPATRLLSEFRHPPAHLHGGVDRCLKDLAKSALSFSRVLVAEQGRLVNGHDLPEDLTGITERQRGQ